MSGARSTERFARLTWMVVALVLLLVPARAPHAQATTPILILVSLDGWRWDYLDVVDAPHLKALAAGGVRSEGLIPSFPTSTFPNHYTLVTGLTPDRHGIVSNTIVDRMISPDRFTMSSRTAKDARWWGGEPIWTTAIRQGQKSAAMFWPGSEAIFPTYWKPFDDTLPNADRVAQVLAWLRLPEAERPSFLTLYMSDVDSASHRSGPLSPGARDAARRVDAIVGTLVAGVEALGLSTQTTLVVVSDHGMSETSSERQIYLSDYLDTREIEIVDSGALVGLNPFGTASVDTIYDKLANRHPSLSVYRRQDLPKWLGYGTHARVPAIVGLVEAGWSAVPNRPSALPPVPRIGGAHGYDPRYRDMHGLFVAAGPRIRRGVIAPTLPNVHVYAFLCAVLGLTPALNDGDPTQTSTLFQR